MKKTEHTQKKKNVEILLFLASTCSMLKAMQIPAHVGRFSRRNVSPIAVYLQAVAISEENIRLLVVCISILGKVPNLMNDSYPNERALV